MWTAYIVFPDRIEYRADHRNRLLESASLDRVIDVGWTAGILQRTKNAGTVWLELRKKKPKDPRESFLLVNVPDPKTVCELIRKLCALK